MLSAGDLHDNLRPIKLGRTAIGCHARTKTCLTSLRIVFAQTKSALTTTVTTSSFTVFLFTTNYVNHMLIRYQQNDVFIFTLQEQVRPSGQSERREPRGSHEQVCGRLPSGRQSFDVPCVASPV